MLKVYIGDIKEVGLPRKDFCPQVDSGGKLSVKLMSESKIQNKMAGTFYTIIISYKTKIIAFW